MKQIFIIKVTVKALSSLCMHLVTTGTLLCALKKVRLVPHVDKAPLPLRIRRLVTSNFLQVENPTHPTAHAPERASVYILGQFRTPKREMNMY